MKVPVINGRSVTITDHAYDRMLELWPHLTELHERLGRPSAQLRKMLREATLTPFPPFRAFFRKEAHQDSAECWSSSFFAFILVPKDEERYILATVEVSNEGRDRLKKYHRTAGEVYAFIKRDKSVPVDLD